MPFDQAFSGFSDDIVVIVAAALLVSAAVRASRHHRGRTAAPGPRISSVRAQLILLVTVVTVLSAFVKNIGALAMMLPVAFQMAKRSNVSPSAVPHADGVRLVVRRAHDAIGTSPNIIVSRLRQELAGQPFAMFDFMPVGLGLSLLGIVFLALRYRLLPQDPQGRQLPRRRDRHPGLRDGRPRSKADRASRARPSRELRKKLSEGSSSVKAVVREGEKQPATQDTVLQEDDRVILEGEPAALDGAVKTAGLELEGDDREPRRRTQTRKSARSRRLSGRARC